MPSYQSPGVYVEEVPSGSNPIAGTGTSTAGFIGVIPGNVVMNELVGYADNSAASFVLKHADPIEDKGTFVVKAGKAVISEDVATIENTKVVFNSAPSADEITVSYSYKGGGVAEDESVGYANNKSLSFLLAHIPDTTKKFTIKVGKLPVASGVGLNEPMVEFDKAPEKGDIKVLYKYMENDEEKDSTQEKVGKADNEKTRFALQHIPILDKPVKLLVGSTKVKKGVALLKPSLVFEQPPASEPIVVSYYTQLKDALNTFKIISPAVEDELVEPYERNVNIFPLKNYPVLCDTLTVKVDGKEPVKKYQGKFSLENDTPEKGRSAFVYRGNPGPPQGKITVTYHPVFESAPSGEVKLCTNFREFERSFGNFSTLFAHNRLLHGAYGFFNNGGTRCFGVWAKDTGAVDTVLKNLEPIDEVALVAAPGVTDATAQGKILTDCEKNENRFAILDSKEKVESFEKKNIFPPDNSNYGALYFPWIEVYDPASKGNIFVGPSGHLAGIYARVDAQRGVHKAPANEVVQGASGLKYAIGKSVQDGLNPSGINCIRRLNGNIRVWGARTIGGDDNGEWMYINVRRLFIYLRESIDKGTQWVVFEPNTPELWAKITRNITAFLTNVWRDGALFGNTPQEAFYVKCDEEINPPEVRDQGQVVTEIGVAVVRPAEFVIFRISQWGGPGSG